MNSSEPLQGQKLDSGAIEFKDSAGETVGMIRKPWAVDANGARLETSLSRENGVVTQHVDLTASTVFPVVADPAWDYIIEYDVENRAPMDVWNMLHAGFNCYFPITGAPQSFPVPGVLVEVPAGRSITASLVHLGGT